MEYCPNTEYAQLEKMAGLLMIAEN